MFCLLMHVMFMSLTRTYYNGAVSNTTASLRQSNLSRALLLLHERAEVTRAELTSALAVSRNTTAQVVGDLVAYGLVEEVDAPRTGRRGRPTTTLRPGPVSPVTVACEVAPHQVRIGVVTLGRRLTDLQVHRLPDDSPQSVIKLLRDLLPAVVARFANRCVGVSVAIYGLVDPSGRVDIAANLGWDGVPLQEELSATGSLGVPVVVGNDASLAALYEARHGAGRHAGTCLYLYGATGVGGGLTVDGRLMSGRHGYTGEVGHMLVNPQGRTCRCGRVGCWETEVDWWALRRRWKPTEDRGADDEVAAREVYQAAERGDEWAIQSVHDTAGWLGEGLGSLLNVIDPDVVVLAGGLSSLYSADPATVLSRALARRIGRPADLREILVVSSDQRDAALLGAAERLLQPVLEQPPLPE